MGIIEYPFTNRNKYVIVCLSNKEAHTRKEKKSMAENTKNTKTEVGIVGQMYENRKTKKRGVLESRNEKFKTLCMRDVEGKTFNIVYSTFKSDWRKYQGDDAVAPVEEKTEEKAEDVKSEKKVEKKSDAPKKPKKETISAEERVKIVLEAKSVVEKLINTSGLKLSVRTLSKGGISIKHTRTVFEVWPKYNGTSDLVVGKEMNFSGEYSKFVKKCDDWKNPYVYNVSDLERALNIVLKTIAPDIEAEEKKKAEKAKNTKEEEK